METILELRVGTFGVVPLAIVSGLLAADVVWTLGVHRALLTQMADRPRGSLHGLALGVWLQTILVAAAGLATLFGSLVAFMLFAAGTLWRALGPGRESARGFLAGYKGSSGRSNVALASTYGAMWVGITRGITLALLYVSIHAV